MPASINDLITDTENSGPPIPTTVSAIRTPNGTTLQCGALTDWPVNTAVHFVTGTPMTDAEGNSIINPATLCLWKAVVSGVDLVDMVLRYSATGSDPGNAINDIVEMAPTSSWAHDLFDALTAEHTTTGGHTSGMTVDGKPVNLLQSWIQADESWAYASSSTMTVPTDATTRYDIGDYIQLTQSSTVKYFVVTAVAATLLTVAGLNGATLVNSAISANSYSKARNPHGTGIFGALPYNPYAFRAFRSGAWTTPANGTAQVIFDATLKNNGSVYNPITGVFTAPIPGIYRFGSGISIAGGVARSIVHIQVNGTDVAIGPDLYTGSNLHGQNATSTEVPLAQNDQVSIVLYTSSGVAGGTGYVTNFTGSLVSAA